MVSSIVCAARKAAHDGEDEGLQLAYTVEILDVCAACDRRLQVSVADCQLSKKQI
jgi:hypothetical protein